ncbi:placenta growth factor isoform B [Alligator mississippiensis]|uniref:Placenta growth factor isoform B n=1 Tax=Alligator mississippiensis TaxID=8496 RepID=A0A151MLK7_ALLMI|nr:placenta growth factor isoform B [Alligator mississippiensis]
MSIQYKADRTRRGQVLEFEPLETCPWRLITLLPSIWPWLDGSLGNSTSDGAVLPFQEVWGRSFCRPLEKLVDIVTEYPSEVEHLFSPSCVSLRRCTGCCGDERLQCVPVEMANVTMQLLRMKPEGQVPYVELSFIEHRQCACRPRRDTLKSGRRRRKGRGTRLITLTGLWRLSY